MRRERELLAVLRVLTGSLHPSDSQSQMYPTNDASMAEVMTRAGM